MTSAVGSVDPYIAFTLETDNGEPICATRTQALPNTRDIRWPGEVLLEVKTPTDAPRMPHGCPTDAPRMLHGCSTDAPWMYHTCITHAPCMHNACTTHARPTQS